MKTLLTTLTILLAAATIQAADKPYPLKKCLVSGNELGSMGTPVTKVYDGQEIKFCCKPCVKKFEANKAKYLTKLPK
jgi:YHS domain-containing protein